MQALTLSLNTLSLDSFSNADELPPKEMLQVTQDLIAYAVDQGYLSANYTLYGHRQVRATECPGNALFNEIKTWPGFESDVVNGI